ncbi:hypothetical protein RCL1_009037 [Eukaryota sp. TZLM3-RCL]
MANNLEEIDLRNFQQLHIKYEATIKLLQQERFPLNKVRDLFGMLSQDCEEAMRPFLEYPSRIMKHPTFECAIVKVLDGHELQLTAQEKNTLTIFQKQVAVEEAREVVLQDSLQLQLERLEQIRKEATSSKYYDLSFIPATKPARLNACSHQRLLFALNVFLCPPKCSTLPYF